MRKIAFALALLLATSAFAARNRSYVFMHGGTNVISGGGAELNIAIAKRHAYERDFLWVRTEAGREYLIRDEATLARVDRLFAPVRASDPQIERLQARMRPLERRERDLEREADYLSDLTDDRKLTSAEERRLDELQRQLRDLQVRLREYEREEETLDRKRDALEEEAERQLWPIVDEAIRNGLAK